MKSTLYIGMALILLSFLGLIGIACMVGLLISVASDSRGMTWTALREQLPTFLSLVAYLGTVGLLVYTVVLSMDYYGA
jgi:hypothetical protein